jgi:hypothetical protein
MRRTLRQMAALGMVAMLAVINAGCGGTGNSGGSSTASIHEKAVKFAECMRNNGVSRFPDPDASGALTIDGVVNGSSVDPNSAAWKHAIGACKDLEPPGFTGTKVTPQQRTARLKFAQCMRENGVPDFPDPTSNGPLIDTNRIPSSNKPGGMTILNAAAHKCGDLLRAAMEGH